MKNPKLSKEPLKYFSSIVFIAFTTNQHLYKRGAK